MQLLFYVVIFTIYISLTAFYYNFLICVDIYNLRFGTFIEIYHKAICLIFYFITVGFAFVITNFFRFHVDLVKRNSTTIESLDKEHAAENARYNISLKDNWIQVFGENILLWFLPFDGEGGNQKEMDYLGK